MESSQYIINHYSNYDEDGRLTGKSGSVEFLTTMRYIEKYIKPSDHVLEIGAATGRYSHALARQGFIVDAVELVEHNIEVFRKNTQDGENVSIDCTPFLSKEVDAMDEDTYELYLKYHFATCEREDLVGITSHSVDIFRK